MGLKVTEVLSAHYGDRMEFPKTDITTKFIQEGRYGRKANKGFYLYKDGKSVLKMGASKWTRQSATMLR